MLSTLFSINHQNYLHNAVVTAHALDFLHNSFGPIKNFRISFKKPFFSQGEFNISFDKLEGYTTGQFDVAGTPFYFAYSPTNVALQDRAITGNDVITCPTTVNMCYHIADRCRGAIENAFKKIYGPMVETDKVIFVICEIPDTSLLLTLIKENTWNQIRIQEAEVTGPRRFKLPVFIGDTFFSFRHSTVKEFIR